MRELGVAGCHVTVSTLNIEVPEEARQLVALTAQAVPLGGIFHLAMYLDDNLVANQVRQPPCVPTRLGVLLFFSRWKVWDC